VSAVISLMSLMSPAGAGEAAFTEALRAGGRTPGGPVAGFEPAEAAASPAQLVNRPSALAVAAVADLLDRAGLDGWEPARRSVVLGSGAAGVDESITMTRDSLTRARPDKINPALVPACVMNYAAALAAMRFDLRGPNVTVTAGRVTGLAALGYARRLLARDRADAVVCGAFEDVGERRTAIAEAAGVKGPAAAGCGVFLVEPAARARAAGRTVLAEILALDTGAFAEPADAEPVLAQTVDRALSRAGVDAADVGLFVPAGEEAPPHAGNPRVVRPVEVFGDAFGAAAALQVAAAITEGSPGGLALVTATDPDGQTGACLLRTP
jgi:3-oxoacyl-[acyl-carrier-protein] synthase II